MSSVLVVAPHPDDEVLGCGGVIARHVASGDDVYVAIVSKGAAEVYPPELVARVREESLLANQALGTKRLLFLDFPAPRLDGVPAASLASAIRDVVVQVRARTVYLPHHGDLHGDHKAVYWATLVASRPNGGFYPARVLCYETPSETEWGAPIPSDAFVPTVFVDVSRYLDVKQQAMKCYRSQLTLSPGARSLVSIESLARVRGCAIGVTAAEAFCLVREVLA